MLNINKIDNRRIEVFDQYYDQISLIQKQFRVIKTLGLNGFELDDRIVELITDTLKVEIPLKADISYSIEALVDVPDAIGTTYYPVENDGTYEIVLNTNYEFCTLTGREDDWLMLQAIETLPHEYRHVWQDVHGLYKDIKMYESDEYDEYLSDPAELDAMNFAIEFIVSNDVFSKIAELLDSFIKKAV